MMTKNLRTHSHKAEWRAHVAFMGRRGNTFIELAVTLLVVLIALAGVISTFLSANDLSDHARETMVAFDDLRDMMEAIHATAFTALPGTFPDGVADGGAGTPYATLVGGYLLPTEQIVVTYPVQTGNQREVVVTLTWVHHGRTRTVSCSTMQTGT